MYWRFYWNIGNEICSQIFCCFNGKICISREISIYRNRNLRIEIMLLNVGSFQPKLQMD